MWKTKLVVLSMLEQLCYLMTEHSVQTLAWKRQGSCSGVGHQEQGLCNSLASKYQAQSGVARSRLLPQRPRLVSLEARGQKRAGHGDHWEVWAADRRLASSVQIHPYKGCWNNRHAVCTWSAEGKTDQNLEDNDEGQHTTFVFPTGNFKSKNTNCE